MSYQNFKNFKKYIKKNMELRFKLEKKEIIAMTYSVKNKFQKV